MRFALATILILAPLDASLAGQYRCASEKECFTATGCETRTVESVLDVKHDVGMLFFGDPRKSRDDWIAYQIQPNSRATHLVGLGGPKNAIGAQSIVVFKNLEFVVTSSVLLNLENQDLAVGISLQGTCERMPS